MALTTDTANQKKFNLREKDFPKLDSIQLDHLLKKTLMENKRKKKYDSNNPKPNLTKARKRGATDVASEDTADKSNNASSPSEEWELPKRPIKRRTTTSTQDNGDINLTENQYQQLSDDSEYEEDENNTDMEVNQAQVNQLKKAWFSMATLYRLYRNSLMCLLTIEHPLALEAKGITNLTRMTVG